MIRKFTVKDIEQAEKLARAFYFPDLWEESDCCSTRLKIYPKGCLAAEINNALVGYSFSHPWTTDKIVNLGDKIEMPPSPDCYYIHDVCVDVNYHGKGIGKLLAQKTMELNTFNTVMLVSVLGSHTFWKTFGFQIVREIQYSKKNRAFVMKYTRNA